MWNGEFNNLRLGPFDLVSFLFQKFMDVNLQGTFTDRGFGLSRVT